MTSPSVTIAIPVLNERSYIESCLDAIRDQTYEDIVEVLVVDGGSTDGTPEIVRNRGDALVLSNPARIQSAGLNLALAAASGEVFVRVDGHSLLAPDYVQSCVAALRDSGAAIVGGAMVPVGQGWLGNGIAAAMRSRIGAGPATFHLGGVSRWTDTVYLGAYATATARKAGGYAEDMGVNEDAEFAIRMSTHGGVWYDERIRSTYLPRSNLTALGRQFYRYGRGRATTVRRHPTSVHGRQLAAPALVLALVSPWRRRIAVGYASAVAARAGAESLRGSPGVGLGMALAIPTMHLSWGTGFLAGLVRAGGFPAGRRRPGGLPS